MTLRDLVGALRRQWVVVLTAVVLATAAAGWSAATAAPTYRASASAFVTATGQSAGTALQGSQFALQQVGSYATLATSATVLQAAANDRALGESVADLRRRVTASNADGTVLVTLTATGPTASDAAALADQVAVSFAAAVEDLGQQGGAGSAPVAVTVVDRAAGTATRSGSRPALVLLAGALAGLLLGGGAAVVRHLLGRRLATAEEVTALLGARPLGVVAAHRRAAADVPAGLAEPTWTEGYRTTRDALGLVSPDGPPQVLLVTSAAQGEGKSTTSCHLALAMAAAGSRVLLVDADLRRPVVASRLGLEASVGLVDVLAGRLELQDAVQPSLHPGLSVLAAGRTPPDPGALLGSRQMRVLLDAARQQHDVVVVDAPPVLPVTDAGVLVGATDGALLVVRAGRTARAEVLEAQERLEQGSGRVLGTVLVAAHPRDVPHGQLAGAGRDQGAQRGWPPAARRAPRPAAGAAPQRADTAPAEISPGR